MGSPVKTELVKPWMSNYEIDSGQVMPLPDGEAMGVYVSVGGDENARFATVYLQGLAKPSSYESYMTDVLPNGDVYKGDKKSTIVDVINGDTAVFVPTGGYSGGTYHVVYNSWGDLRIVDIVTRPATAIERYDGGETLTCAEEREVATNDAKQIGLGIIQYVQDYDERLPLTDNFHDEVYPYIKSDQVMKPLGKYNFVYAPPDDLLMESLSDPASYVLGYIDLPCGRVTLYADGHVK